MMLDPIRTCDDDPPIDAGHELIQFMTDWGALAGRRDALTLDRMLPDDLIITRFDGKILTKADYLDALRALPADFRLTDYGQTTQIFDRTAIVRAAYKLEMRGEIHLRYTATFIKRREKWEVVALHSSVATKEIS
jgi:hypothetical protein